MPDYTKIDSEADINALSMLTTYWKGGWFAKLDKLPYPKESLAPHMSKELVEWLYEVNHKNVVDSLVKNLKESDGLLELMDFGLNGTNRVRELTEGIKFHGQLHANYQFFWDGLCPSGSLKEIKDDSSSAPQESSNPL